jgi:hypothetical protein
MLTSDDEGIPTMQNAKSGLLISPDYLKNYKFHFKTFGYIIIYLYLYTY